MIKSEYKYSAETGLIIGTAMEVHRQLGNGFREVIYQRSLAIELGEKMIPFKREFEIPVFYKTTHVGKQRVDFLIYDKICVELKAKTKVEPVDLAQAINYLEAFNLEIGLLINFGNTSLEFKRLLNSKFDENIPNKVSLGVINVNYL